VAYLQNAYVKANVILEKS